MFQGGADGTTETTVGRVTLDTVRALADQAAVVLEHFDPDDVLYSESVEMHAAFSRLERLGNAGATLVARRVDESKRWEKAGHRTVDDFIAAETGEGLGEARKQRKTSERLRDLPDTEEQLRKGNLSREQADLVSDGAAANPAAEDSLLDDARKKSVKDLKDQAARAKAAADRTPDDTQKRIRAGRKFTDWHGPDGSHQFFGKGPVEDAAVINAALQPYVDRYYRERRNTPDQGDRQHYRWDALTQLARDSLAGNTAATTPGGPNDDETTDSDGTGDTTPAPTRKKSASPPYLGILRTDHSALVRGWTEDDELCEIAGLGPIPVTRARELLGESTLRLVLTTGIDVQNVTYLGRGPNAAQKIALLWSQPICTNIACGHTWLEDDHRDPYANCRKTELHNLDPLCPHDHDLKTYKGWALVPGTGRRAFVPPDHPQHPDNSPDPTTAPDRPSSGREPPGPDHGPPADDLPPTLFPDSG